MAPATHPSSLTSEMFERHWFSSQKAKRWPSVSKRHVSDEEGAIYLLCSTELAVTSQRAHLSRQLYCTLCRVHAANELWTNVHKL